MGNMNDLLTKLSLSLHFQVSTRTIDRWERRGMPTIIIGKVHRYDLSKVMEWVNLNDQTKAINKIKKEIPY